MVDWEYTKKIFGARGFEEFGEQFLRILPEGGGGLVPFHMRPIQRWYYLEMLLPKLEAGEPVRDMVLKCRQTGFSTFFEAFLFWQTLGHSGWNSLVIASKESQSKLIFRMMRRFDRNLRKADREGLLPLFVKCAENRGYIEYRVPQKMRKYDGRTDVADLDSRIEVMSSMDQGDLGRAGTYQSAHCSEVAFWPDIVGSMSTLLACIPERRESCVFLETTGNGMNEFYSLWNNGVFSDGTSGGAEWRRIFVPWYWDNRYEVSAEYAEKNSRRGFVNEYEEWLSDKITNDSTLRQIESCSGGEITELRVWAKILWRRVTLRNRFFVEDQNDEESLVKFKQEFPATETEAFMFTGRSVFSAGTIQRLEKMSRNPIWTGNVRVIPPDASNRNRLSSAEFESRPFGALRVYEWPEPGEHYCVFADVAEGKGLDEKSAKRRRADWSCAQILKVSSYPPMKQVAVWHGSIDPDIFGDLLVALASKYNNALLGWEINGPGASIAIQVLQKNGYRNIYLREDFDSYTSSVTKRPGWRTTRRTKPVMITSLVHYTRSGYLEVYDQPTIAEMKSFSQVGEGKYEAGDGNDDRVIALAGAVKIIEPYLDVIEARRRRKQLSGQTESSTNPDDQMFSGNAKEVNRWIHPYLGSEW